MRSSMTARNRSSFDGNTYCRVPRGMSASAETARRVVPPPHRGSARRAPPTTCSRRLGRLDVDHRHSPRYLTESFTLGFGHPVTPLTYILVSRPTDFWPPGRARTRPVPREDPSMPSSAHRTVRTTVGLALALSAGLVTAPRPAAASPPAPAPAPAARRPADASRPSRWSPATSSRSPPAPTGSTVRHPRSPGPTGPSRRRPSTRSTATCTSCRPRRSGCWPPSASTATSSTSPRCSRTSTTTPPARTLPVMVDYGTGRAAPPPRRSSASLQGAERTVTIPELGIAAFHADKKDAPGVLGGPHHRRRRGRQPDRPGGRRGPGRPRRPGQGDPRGLGAADPRPGGLGSRATTAPARRSPCSTPATTPPTPTCRVGS